jgi:HSP20 family protein
MENLLRYDPFQDTWGNARTSELAFMPRFDVKETKDSFLFKADVPGIKEEDVEINVTGNRLTITGKRDAEEQKEGENWYVVERKYGSFNRVFTLPDSADAEKIKANLKDGVLHLVLPKRAESQPRRINLAKS